MRPADATRSCTVFPSGDRRSREQVQRSGDCAKRSLRATGVAGSKSSGAAIARSGLCVRPAYPGASPAERRLREAVFACSCCGTQSRSGGSSRRSGDPASGSPECWLRIASRLRLAVGRISGCARIAFCCFSRSSRLQNFALGGWGVVGFRCGRMAESSSLACFPSRRPGVVSGVLRHHPSVEVAGRFGLVRRLPVRALPVRPVVLPAAPDFEVTAGSAVRREPDGGFFAWPSAPWL